MSWREILPVHPAAELFPMMNSDELSALGEDIKKNGLANDIVLWSDSRDRLHLLDGRNRLDAMEIVGVTTVINGTIQPSWRLCHLSGGTTDPWEYVLSANVHRRHLTPSQRRDVIAALLRERPNRSNRQTAKLVGADHKTVSSVRDDLEGRGEIPHVDAVTDSKGRKQPARRPKPRRRPALEVAPEPGYVSRELIARYWGFVEILLDDADPEVFPEGERKAMAGMLRGWADRLDPTHTGNGTLFEVSPKMNKPDWA